MARRSHPALYEVIRSKGPFAPPRSEAGAVPPPIVPGPLASGQIVRIPVGYLWVSIGAVIAACVVSYVIGHASGRRIADRERSDQIVEAVGAAERAQGGVSDPLRQTVGGRTAEGTSTERGAETRRPVGTPGLGTADPRVAGWHYYVLAHGTEEGAPRMAGFLSDHGVDARVVPDHNGRLRKVIALPGLADRADQSSAEAERLRKSIEDALRQWRQASGERARRGSPEYYLEQHRPQQR